MTERISRAEMFMQMAEVVKQRSTCARRAVGCVITDWDGSSVVAMMSQAIALAGKDGRVTL